MERAIVLLASTGCSGDTGADRERRQDVQELYNAELESLQRLQEQRSKLIEDFQRLTEVDDARTTRFRRWSAEQAELIKQLPAAEKERRERQRYDEAVKFLGERAAEWKAADERFVQAMDKLDAQMREQEQRVDAAAAARDAATEAADE